MAPATSPKQSLCQQPDCGGTLSEGYCDCCGMAQRKGDPSNSDGLSSPGFSQTEFSPVGLSQRLGQSGEPSLGSTPSSSLDSSQSSLSQGSRSMGASRRSDRTALGFGLISLPEPPSKQPEAQVLADPQVPENKRFCGHCDARVRREQGFCSRCGSRYSFIPSLEPGDLIGGQYEVKGAIAYGGLGWIYLAFDQLLSRYVVLKGLLNSEDSASAAVALAERQFLAAVKHPNIVNIYNFVTHDSEGFIVMEYVAGQTIRDLRRDRGPLPVAEAIAYIHRILKAFTYLHEQGLVYCDFKPDNLMLEGGDVKLIDLGAVRRLDDSTGDIYGALGYSAPEAGEGPTVQSDLFTIGRTLAVLVAQIPDFNTTHRFILPGPTQLPLFHKYQSLYRFLCRATAKRPSHRFQSAKEMAEQLLGVMRQVLALEMGQNLPFTSQHFGADPLSLTLSPVQSLPSSSETKLAERLLATRLLATQLLATRLSAAKLPLPLVDSTDPAYELVLNALALPDPAQREAQVQSLIQQNPDSMAAQLSWIQLSLTAAGDHVASVSESAAPVSESSVQAPGHGSPTSQQDPLQIISDALHAVSRSQTRTATPLSTVWRLAWLWGQLRLMQLRPGSAQPYFEKVYQHLPGELPPQLALAFTHEQLQDFAIAQEFYYRVWQTDSSYLSAAFGLARCCDAQDKKAQAVQVLAQIPPTAPLYHQARLLMIQLLLREPSSSAEAVSMPMDLKHAAQLIPVLPSLQRHHCAQQLFCQALNQLATGGLTANPQERFLDYPLSTKSLRKGLEQSLRDQAQSASKPAKVKLVDQANRFRSRTWF